MPKQIQCDACDSRFSLSDKLFQSHFAGKRAAVKCKKCGAKITLDFREGRTGSSAAPPPSVPSEDRSIPGMALPSLASAATSKRAAPRRAASVPAEREEAGPVQERHNTAEAVELGRKNEHSAPSATSSAQGSVEEASPMPGSVASGPVPRNEGAVERDLSKKSGASAPNLPALPTKLDIPIPRPPGHKPGISLNPVSKQTTSNRISVVPRPPAGSGSTSSFQAASAISKPKLNQPNIARRPPIVHSNPPMVSTGPVTRPGVAAQASRGPVTRQGLSAPTGLKPTGMPKRKATVDFKSTQLGVAPPPAARAFRSGGPPPREAYDDLSIMESLPLQSAPPEAPPAKLKPIPSIPVGNPKSDGKPPTNPLAKTQASASTPLATPEPTQTLNFADSEPTIVASRELLEEARAASRDDGDTFRPPAEELAARVSLTAPGHERVPDDEPVLELRHSTPTPSEAPAFGTELAPSDADAPLPAISADPEHGPAGVARSPLGSVPMATVTHSEPPLAQTEDELSFELPQESTADADGRGESEGLSAESVDTADLEPTSEAVLPPLDETESPAPALEQKLNTVEPDSTSYAVDDHPAPSTSKPQKTSRASLYLAAAVVLLSGLGALGFWLHKQGSLAGLGFGPAQPASMVMSVPEAPEAPTPSEVAMAAPSPSATAEGNAAMEAAPTALTAAPPAVPAAPAEGETAPPAEGNTAEEREVKADSEEEEEEEGQEVLAQAEGTDPNGAADSTESDLPSMGEPIPPELNPLVVDYKAGLAMKRARNCHPGGHASGTAKVLIRIGNDGRAEDAQLIGEPLASSPVGNCIRAQAMTMRIPKFSGEPFTYETTITMN